jgi:hypothetical protein
MKQQKVQLDGTRYRSLNTNIIARSEHSILHFGENYSLFLFSVKKIALKGPVLAWYGYCK